MMADGFSSDQEGEKDHDPAVQLQGSFNLQVISFAKRKSTAVGQVKVRGFYQHGGADYGHEQGGDPGRLLVQHLPAHTSHQVAQE